MFITQKQITDLTMTLLDFNKINQIVTEARDYLEQAQKENNNEATT